MRRRKIGGGVKDPFSCLRFLYPHDEVKKSSSNPHTRLAQFHLAILELVEQKQNESAYQIYLDLVSKKEEFVLKEDPCKDEFWDIFQDIVATLSQEGFPVSKHDLDVG